jgi:hypothetical protein
MTIRNGHLKVRSKRYTSFQQIIIGGERMTATDAQVRLIMRERSKGRTQEQAAIEATYAAARQLVNINNWENFPVN